MTPFPQQTRQLSGPSLRTTTAGVVRANTAQLFAGWNVPRAT